MKLVFTVHTDPRSSTAEVAMETILAEDGPVECLEDVVKREIEDIMGWQTIRVRVERILP